MYIHTIRLPCFIKFLNKIHMQYIYCRKSIKLIINVGVNIKILLCILISQQTRLMKMFIMRKPNMTTYFVELVMTQILGDDVQKCLEFSPRGDQTQRIYTPMDQIQRIYSHGHNPVFQLL